MFLFYVGAEKKITKCINTHIREREKEKHKLSTYFWHFEDYTREWDKFSTIGINTWIVTSKSPFIR